MRTQKYFQLKKKKICSRKVEKTTPKSCMLMAVHTIYPGNNMCQKCGRKSGLWVLHEIVNKTYAENMKKLWVPFGSYLLNTTAYSAQFVWKWAGLAVLSSR